MQTINRQYSICRQTKYNGLNTKKGQSFNSIIVNETVLMKRKRDYLPMPWAMIKWKIIFAWDDDVLRLIVSSSKMRWNERKRVCNQMEKKMNNREKKSISTANCKEFIQWKRTNNRLKNIRFKAFEILWNEFFCLLFVITRRAEKKKLRWYIHSNEAISHKITSHWIVFALVLFEITCYQMRDKMKSEKNTSNCRFV